MVGSRPGYLLEMMMVVEDHVEVDQIHVDQRLFSSLSPVTKCPRTHTISHSHQLVNRASS